MYLYVYVCTVCIIFFFALVVCHQDKLLVYGNTKFYLILITVLRFFSVMSDLDFSS